MRERVAIIKNSYTPYGGAEKYTGRVVDAFARRGYAVDVLTSARHPWGSESVTRVPIAAPSFSRLLRVYAFNENSRRYLAGAWNRYRCVLTMERTDTATHIRAGGGSHRAWLERRGRFLSPARRATLALNPFHQLVLAIERRSVAAPQLRKLICNSRMVQREFLEHYGLEAAKTAVVHNGVEWGALAAPFAEAPSARPRLKRELGLPPDAFHFLFVGSGYERKGLRFALEALRRLPRDCRLVVVGRDRDEAGYRRAAGRGGLGGRVTFAGPRGDVVPFLQACDAFVLPTLYDPFSNATIEALAMGLYVVTTAANGCAEILGEASGTVVQDLADPDELQAAMRSGLVSRDRVAIRESVRAHEFEGRLGQLIDVCTSQ
jgi:UDP-glucose:(heptosyl)LPS alpha-1,3-glucosyltransferase